jgi:hypothetical protein
MKSAKIEITVIKTDSGMIRIQFDDKSSYPIPDVMANIGIVSALEVELEYALKKLNDKTTSSERPGDVH